MKKIMYVFFIFVSVFSFVQPLFARDLSYVQGMKLLEDIKASGADDASMTLNLTIPIEPIEECPGHTAVNLTATLVRPQEKMQELPTIIIATAYRRELCISMGTGLLNHGYNILAVDNRGSGSSGDGWEAFDLAEQYDIKYIIDSWIPKQEWSNGKVGMFGASYMGIIELMAAGLIDVDPATDEPLHLKAIFPYVPMSDPYRTVAFQGGNFDEEFMIFWLALTDILAILPPRIALGDEGLSGLDDIIMTWITHLAQIPVHVGWITTSGNDSYNDFYKVRSAQLYWPQKPEGGWQYDDGSPLIQGQKVMPSSLPVFIVGGWFDIFTMSTLDTYSYGLEAQSAGDKALVMGPWYHACGSMGLGIEGLSTENADIAARWFDWKINGKSDSFMKEWPVLIYVMGEDKWRAEKSWPLADSRVSPASLFLSKKKPSKITGDWFSKDNEDNNFSLKKDVSIWDYRGDNPEMVHNPIDLKGMKSRSCNRWMAGGMSVSAQTAKFTEGADDSANWWEDERNDEEGVLTFTTEPLEENIELTGPVSLTFWASTMFTGSLAQDAVLKVIRNIQTRYNIDENLIEENLTKKDVQWVIELNDVFEDGRAKNITSGWLSAWRRPFNPASGRYTEADPAYEPLDPFYIVNRKNRGEPLVNEISEGTVYCYVVEIWPSANIFKKGHRIRISISGSDFPHLLPILVPSVSTIVIDSDHQARLDFKTVNADDEGVTWRWLRNRIDSRFNKYAAAIPNEFDAANSFLLGLGEDELPETSDEGEAGGESSGSPDSSSAGDGSKFCFVTTALNF